MSVSRCSIALWLLGFFASSCTSTQNAAPSSDQSEAPLSQTDIDNFYNQGIKVEEILIGSGEEVKRGRDITIHYIEMLDNREVVVSSYDKGKPYRFLVGGHRVLAGLDRGVVGMRVGGKRRLFIPPWLAYGRFGQGCDEEGKKCAIPPLSHLIIEVELIEIHDDSLFK